MTRQAKTSLSSIMMQRQKTRCYVNRGELLRPSQSLSLSLSLSPAVFQSHTFYLRNRFFLSIEIFSCAIMKYRVNKEKGQKFPFCDIIWTHISTNDGLLIKCKISFLSNVNMYDYGNCKTNKIIYEFSLNPFCFIKFEFNINFVGARKYLQWTIRHNF